jgi:predicted Zn-dependent protease
MMQWLNIVQNLKNFKIIFLIITLFAQSVFAFPIIRDAEIENVISQISTPIFKAAGLKNRDMNIFIISDSNINAFATQGNMIFLNSGLIIAAKTPEMLASVIAHETGHIKGGHVILQQINSKDITIATIIPMLAGMAIAIASGSADAGMAIGLGASQINMRQQMGYSRTHEQNADQAAISYLNKANIPITGMLDMFKTLNSQTRGIENLVNPYAITHPLTKDRISIVRSYLNQHKNQSIINPIITHKYERALLKLISFTTKSPQRLLDHAQFNQNDDNSKYGKAILLYRSSKITEALELIDNLIKNNPDDPYIHELAGQILLENGKGKEALQNYMKASQLLPRESLFYIGVAVCQIAIAGQESNNKGLINAAITNLKKSIGYGGADYTAYQMLGESYGKIGNKGMSYYYLAEAAMEIGNKKMALRNAKEALNHLKDKNIKLKLDDIIKMLE